MIRTWKPKVRLRYCLRGFTAVGISFFIWLLGATMMYFNWGPAHALKNAFIGMDAYERRKAPSRPQPARMGNVGLIADKSELAQDGFTLYTSSEGCIAKLIDMKGNVVHEWHLPFSEVWSNPPHVKLPLPDDRIHWFRSRLLPNGDLLALYYADGDTPHGYGLVKMDRNSKLVWKYADNTHHDFDVDEHGNIYALTQRFSHEQSGSGQPDDMATLADSIVVLSPDGQETNRISLIDALANSPYALILNSLNQHMDRRRTEQLHPKRPPNFNRPPVQVSVSTPNNGLEVGDFLHANGIKVLTQQLAPKFPFLKAGEVIISLRNADALFALDLESKRVVWAVCGLWRAQHDPEFLPNGHILIFDNQGSADGSRVVEFDPATNSYPWVYSGENNAPFMALVRGAKQRLSSGNTLIAEPDTGRIFEVTSEKEIVWEYRAPYLVTGFTRYSPESLSFLPPGTSPRPQ